MIRVFVRSFDKITKYCILNHILHKHDNNIHNNNDLKQLINNDNISSVKNGVESNAVEFSYIILHSVVSTIYSFLTP